MIETATVEIKIKTTSVNAAESVELVLAFEKAVRDLAMQHLKHSSLKHSSVDIESNVTRCVRVYG